MSAGVVGMGLWVPDTIRRKDAWPDSFADSFHASREERRRRDFTDVSAGEKLRPYEALFARHASQYDDDPFKGAVERRIASPDVPTAEGDTIAAKRALEDARVDPQDVDLIVASALVPDRLVPSNGPHIQDALGCVRAAAIGVESYCSSAISQVDLSAALVESGRARFVLCVQSHQIARINDLALPFSPIFGDASTAFVVGAVAEGRGLSTVARGGDGSLRAAITHTYPSTPNARWWHDARAPIRPGSDDPRLARIVAENSLAYGIDTIREVCSMAKIPIDAVRAFATVQPMAWYQAALADGLGVPPARIPTTYPRYGHLGGAGVIANLIEARELGLLTDRAPIVLFGTGAGITRFAALLRWADR